MELDQRQHTGFLVDEKDQFSIMGLDVGKVRIGVAMSDPLQIIAGTHSVIQCKTIEEDLQRIQKLAEEHRVHHIVVGLPLTLKGGESQSTQRARAFAEALQKSLPQHTIELWDERLSTVQAESVLIEASVRRKKRKQKVDKVAAALILQNYLDRKRTRKL